jgi:hypothetical protein
MRVTIYTDTNKQAQQLFDLCCISDLDTYEFTIDSTDENGIDIVITELEHKFALRRIIDYVFEHFNLEGSK